MHQTCTQALAPALKSQKGLDAWLGQYHNKLQQAKTYTCTYPTTLIKCTIKRLTQSSFLCICKVMSRNKNTRIMSGVNFYTLYQLKIQYLFTMIHMIDMLFPSLRLLQFKTFSFILSCNIFLGVCMHKCLAQRRPWSKASTEECMAINSQLIPVLLFLKSIIGSQQT